MSRSPRALRLPLPFLWGSSTGPSHVISEWGLCWDKV